MVTSMFLRFRWYRGLAVGCTMGVGLPSSSKQSARYWLVQEEFATEKVKPRSEEEEYEYEEDPAKLIGNALFQEIFGEDVWKKWSKTRRRR